MGNVCNTGRVSGGPAGVLPLQELDVQLNLNLVFVFSKHVGSRGVRGVRVFVAGILYGFWAAGSALWGRSQYYLFVLFYVFGEFDKHFICVRVFFRSILGSRECAE